MAATVEPNAGRTGEGGEGAGVWLGSGDDVAQRLALWQTDQSGQCGYGQSFYNSCTWVSL